MQENYMEELKSLCQKTTPVLIEKRLEIGETTWLEGRPAASVKGTVALQIGEGHSIVIPRFPGVRS
jgi:hypothetical protein